MAAALATPVWAEGETGATVVATVNGTEITLGQMIALRENLPDQYQSLPDDVLFKGILDQLVQQEMMAQAHGHPVARAMRQMWTMTAAAICPAWSLQSVVAARSPMRLCRPPMTRGSRMRHPMTEYNAAHILVETEEKAKELKAQLDGGADFAELAKANSIDTGSGAMGGDLGWFGLGMMVKPFEDAVVARRSRQGQLTRCRPISAGTWSCVKETRVAANPTLDEMREELAGEIEAKAIDAKIAELTAAAKIERPGEALDPALLKKTELID